MDLWAGDDPEVMHQAIRAVARATALAGCTEELLEQAVELVGRAAQLVAMEAAPEDWVSQVRAQTAVVSMESARSSAAAVYEHVASAAASLASAAGMMGDFVGVHHAARAALPGFWTKHPGDELPPDQAATTRRGE
jgi:hypothetical protein